MKCAPQIFRGAYMIPPSIRMEGCEQSNETCKYFQMVDPHVSKVSMS
jgi:hypothetical protein